MSAKVIAHRIRSRFCRHVPELWMDDGAPLYICEKCGCELDDPDD